MSSCPYASELQKNEGPRGCTWKAANSPKSPHQHVPFQGMEKPKIMTSVLDHVGLTPMIRLHTIPKEEGLECEILAKCEFFNAGGSVKDRIGKRMILDAQASGRIKKGDTLIEPTSGNTGIGMALTAAIEGYKMIITLPEKMSQEKVDVLKALGAEIIRTPTEAAFDSPESHIGVATKLNATIPNSHILDQYKNPSNPLAHYDGTAEEILYQCDDKVDVVVMGAGTGGTFTGIARKLKERCPNVRVVGVDPHGSILALPSSLNKSTEGYQVEGIGYDFIPNVLDRSLGDLWIKSDDYSSFNMSRRLIRKEGLLCGGSSGSAMAAAIKVAKDLKLTKEHRVVVVLADSVRNYMSKFLNDQWMIDRGFMKAEQVKPSQWWSNNPVSALELAAPITVDPTVTCKGAVDILTKFGIDQMPVVSVDGSVKGMVTMGNLSAKMIAGRVADSDTIENVLFTQYKAVSPLTALSELSNVFDKDHFALVITTQKHHNKDGTEIVKSHVFGVATRIDLLNYIMKGQKV